jgi:signal peptidase II
VEPAKRRAAAVLLGTAGLVLILDRVTKTWAGSTLPGHPVDLIRGVLTLRYETNSGGAFSLGQNAPWLFASASLAVSLVIVVTAFRHTRTVTAVALGLILGGALGNLIDRVVRGDGLVGGRVIDFIDLHWWPVFNLADGAIVVGALMLGFASWQGRKPADDPEGTGGAEGTDG